MDQRTPMIRVDSLEWDGTQPGIYDNHHEHAIQTSASVSLEDLLRRKGIMHADGDGKLFWPMSALKKVMTESQILQELKRVKRVKGLDGDLFQLAHTIAAGYCKVFALLTLVGKAKHIQKFIQNGVKDQHLPLHAREAVHLNIFQRGPPYQRLACFDLLKTADREVFLQYQHQINPVYLGFNQEHGNVLHVDLPSKAILPFTTAKAIREGGYSTVKEVTVHPDCHGFNDVLKPVCDHRLLLWRL